MISSRPLGDVERSVWLLDREGSLICAIVVRVTGPLDAALVRRALDRWQARWPLLGVRIEPSDPPALTPADVPPVPLETAARQDDRQVLDVVERAVNTPFPWERGPLARALLLLGEGEADLVLAFHHAVADGRSMVLYAADLVEIAGALAGGRAPPEGRARLPPPLEAGLPPEARGLAGLGLAALDGARRLRDGELRRGPILRLAPDERVPPRLRRTRLARTELDAGETAALARRCREEGTSVHGAIAAAALGALVPLLDPRQTRGVLGCSTPVDLRGRLASIGEAEAGLFISGVITFHARDRAERFWDLAREVTAGVRDAIERGEVLRIARAQGLAARAAGTPERFARMFERFSPATVAVTNIGRVELPVAAGPLAGRVLFFGAAGNAAAGSTPAVGASTSSGRLSLTFGHAEPLLSAARAAAFEDAVVGRLRGAARLTL